jgi:prevent-host-death family protein
MGWAASDVAEEVGIRALRNALSRYLAAVRDGQELVVTDRGRPVARIVPATGGLDRLAELVAEGKVRPAHPGPRPTPTPRKARGTISDLVTEQRR